MAQEHIPDERIISAQFPGTCTDCGAKFPQGTLIKHNRYKKTARHVKCPDPYDGEKLYGMWVQLGKETARVGIGVKE